MVSRLPDFGPFILVAQDASRRFPFPWDSPGCLRSANKWGPFCPKKYYGGEAETIGTFPPILAPNGVFRGETHPGNLARRGCGGRDRRGGRAGNGPPGRGEPRGAPAIAVKVARSALVRGAKILKKILKIFLGPFKLEERLIGIGPALLMLQSEGLSFFPMYRGKCAPSQGGVPRQGGGAPPGVRRCRKYKSILISTVRTRSFRFFSAFSNLILAGENFL